MMGWELGKALRPRNLLITALLALLAYTGFVSGMLDVFEGGHPSIEGHDLAVANRHRFGPYLDESALKQLRSERELLWAEADAVLATSSELTAAGLTRFEDWHLTSDDELYSVGSSLLYSPMTDPRPLGFRIDALTHLIEEAEDAPTGAYPVESEYLLEVMHHHAARLMGLVFVVALIVAAPLATEDRHHRVTPLQRSSRVGPQLLWRQYLATVCAALAVGLVTFGVGMLPLERTSIGIFLDDSMHGLGFLPAPVVPLSLGVYLAALGLLAALISLTAGGIAWLLSLSSSTLVRLVGLLAVVAVPGAWLTTTLTSYSFLKNNLVYRVVGIPGIELLLQAILLTLIGTAGVLLTRHHLSADET